MGVPWLDLGLLASTSALVGIGASFATSFIRGIPKEDLMSGRIRVGFGALSGVLAILFAALALGGWRVMLSRPGAVILLAVVSGVVGGLYGWLMDKFD